MKTESLQHLSLKEYAKYLPPESSSTETNFNELVKLTTRTDVNFRIDGSPEKFSIDTKAYNWVIVPLLVIIQVLPLIIVIERPDLIISWAILAAFILGPLIGTRYSKGPNNVLVDTKNQTLLIRSNSAIGKFIIPSKVLKFGEILRLETNQRIVSGKQPSVASKWTDVFAITKTGRIHVISLPAGPFHYVNFTVFQLCLERIIKNGAQQSL